MSKSIKPLTKEEKKGLVQLTISIVVTGILFMINAFANNIFIAVLEGIGIFLTAITFYRMLMLTKVEKENNK